jgi:hypothetical protein
MNNNDVIIYNTDRKGIDRCHCPQCKGCAGTARVCFNSRKLAARPLKNALTKTAGLFLLLGCLSLQGRATAAGPTDFAQNDKVSVGYLKVFSSTQESQWGEGSYYYLHTGYRIYDSTGQAVKWVDNHNTSIDETPQKVELAPGAYTVWAQSEKDGYVKVPVVIKPARTTAVHLESDRARNADHL